MSDERYRNQDDGGVPMIDTRPDTPPPAAAEPERDHDPVDCVRDPASCVIIPVLPNEPKSCGWGNHCWNRSYAHKCSRCCECGISSDVVAAEVTPPQQAAQGEGALHDCAECRTFDPNVIASAIMGMLNTLHLLNGLDGVPFAENVAGAVRDFDRPDLRTALAHRLFNYDNIAAEINRIRVGTPSPTSPERAAQSVVDDFGAVAAIEAAEALCHAYFDIAAELIGEDEVRRRRDEKLSQFAMARSDSENQSRTKESS